MMVNESRSPERSENRAAGESRPFQTNPAGVRSSSGSSAARSSASGPSVVGVGLGQRPLVGGRVDVRVEDPGVRVVEPGRLDPPLEQRLGLAHEELVERVLARHEDREPVPAAPGPAPLLAQRGDGAGKPDRDRAVELTDVDPELEGVGRRDAEQLALHQPPLDLAPLRGRVAGPVGREACRRGGVDAIRR